MTVPLRQTLCEHAAGNYRILMNLAGELLAQAAQRELPQIDEKLYLEIYTVTPEPPSQAVSAPVGHCRHVHQYNHDITMTYHQPSGITQGRPLLIDANWTPAQAWAVIELLDDLRDRLLAHYPLGLTDWLANDRPNAKLRFPDRTND
ncbi:hypothetical protein [Cupriavidus necator]